MGSLFAVFFFLTFPGYAQVKSIGTPSIENYSKSLYNAGTQNWSISQDKNGLIYFANNDGVLRFDGLHWDLIEVSETSPVRSVFVDSNNQIYCGAFNDFGTIRQNRSGPPRFYSFRKFLPDSLAEFDDIWQIHEIADGIVFQSFDDLFLYADNQIKVITPQRRYHFSFHVNGRLFLHEPGEGLFEYMNGSIHMVPWADELKNAEIWTILEIKDNHLLIGTREHGIYKFENGFLTKWQTPVNEFLRTNRLYSATVIPGTHFVFGTILNGLVISDADGNIVQHINRQKGLQNNTVLSVYPDRNGNLWLGLDNGIDYIEINSPLSFFSDKEGLGTGYCCEVFEGRLYLGTNQGLYVKSFNDFTYTNEPFELIENTAGQVWSLGVYDDQLICGHNSGTFVIEDKEAVKIGDEEGAWKYIPLKNRQDMLIGGHYYGLVLLKKLGDGRYFFEKIKGFNESSRFIYQDNDSTLWISHGGKGVFRVHMNEAMDSVTSYRLYTAADGLPSSERNILFAFDGQAFISAIDGIYQYRESSDSFRIHKELNQLLSFDGQLLTLKTDNQGNIWFIAANESGVIRRNEDMSYTKITAPFKQLDGKYVNGFEYLNPLNSDHVFFGMDNGFAHYSPKILKSYSEKFSAFITKVEMPYIDTTFYCNPENPSSDPEVPFRRNVFRFHYAAPFFESLEQLRFSYFLENYSEGWSEWSQDRYRDYTNLPEGDYAFSVKAKNIYDIESEISTFSFTVLPPWHRSRQAYYVYILLLGSMIFVVVKFVLHRIEKSRERQKMKHDQELQKRDELFKHQSLIAEKEIIRLRNEKLRDEMIHRDKELANQTNGIIQKNKFLLKLRNELLHIQKHSDDSQVKLKIAGLNKRINREIDNRQQKQLFDTYFDEVHQVFFDQLKQRFPQLSPREMRLSAYIRMNLTSKEIAALLNITDRGVEISRYRLRKKLKISRETNLSTFLSNI